MTGTATEARRHDLTCGLRSASQTPIRCQPFWRGRDAGSSPPGDVEVLRVPDHWERLAAGAGPHLFLSCVSARQFAMGLGERRATEAGAEVRGQAPPLPRGDWPTLCYHNCGRQFFGDSER